MVRAPASALRSKYSHHSPALPMNATTNAATVGAALACGAASGPASSRASVAPVTTIDSPSAIRMKPWQRSAK